jgi:hypothetical protein
MLDLMAHILVWYSSGSDPAFRLSLKRDSLIADCQGFLLDECTRNCSSQWGFCISRVLDTEASHPLSVNGSRAYQADCSIDLHTGNIAFTLPPLDSLSEESLLNRLGSPRTGPVRAADGRPIPPEMPRYLVWPANTPIDESILQTSIRIIDFGESFFPGERPQTLHTPLALRAPELLLGDDWDHRADLWTLGCTVSNTAQTQCKVYLIWKYRSSSWSLVSHLSGASWRRREISYSKWSTLLASCRQNGNVDGV